LFSYVLLKGNTRDKNNGAKLKKNETAGSIIILTKSALLT